MCALRCGTENSFSLIQSGWWTTSEITYRIDAASMTADIGVADVRQGLVQAFNEWNRVTVLTFTEVTAGGHIVIAFHSGGQEGDVHKPFDGAGGVLANGGIPTSAGADHVLHIHFDDDETWSLEAAPVNGSADFVAVAMYEIGHNLGLAAFR